MFKKSLLYVTLASTILGTVGSATVFAATDSPQDGTKDVEVTYKNIDGIPDPENPTYIVTVPASIRFTDENRRVDTQVSLTDPEGNPYEADKKVTVSVFSANDYLLKNEGNKGNGNKADEMVYKLITGTQTTEKGTHENGQLVTNDNEQSMLVGTLSSEVQTITGYAVLEGEAENIGTYEDTLTYTVKTVEQ